MKMRKPDTTVTLIQPALLDSALLADISANGIKGDLRLHLWWLGQSGFLLKHDGRAFLFDPYLSDSLTRKYATTDKPHIRMTARCVEPSRLPNPEFVTASHVHTDHLDPETLTPLADRHPGLRLVLPWPVLEEARARLSQATVEYLPMDAGQCLHGDGWELHALASAHNELKTDAQGRHHYLGFVLVTGPYRIYHSGDTLWHAGLVPELLHWNCDVMMLPINGNHAERRVSGNLNGMEAAALARACGARHVVPCHYEMFTFNTEPPDEFATACQRLGQPYTVVRCGERLTLDTRE